MKKSKNFYIHDLDETLEGHLYPFRATINDKMLQLKEITEVVSENKKTIVRALEIYLLNLIKDKSLEKLMKKNSFLNRAVDLSLQLNIDGDKLIPIEIAIKDSDFYACGFNHGVKQKGCIRDFLRTLNKSWKKKAKMTVIQREEDHEDLQYFRFEFLIKNK